MTTMTESRGHPFRTRHGRWALRSKAHFHWLIRTWWETGYEAGVRDAAHAAEVVAPEWHHHERRHIQHAHPRGAVRALVKSAGFTIDGLPDDLAHTQMFNLAARLMLASDEARREAQR